MWRADEIAQAHGIARELGLAPPTMEQPEYNLFARRKVEREFARLYDAIGLGTTIWSPLASGLLTGKYDAGVPAGSRMALPEYKWLREEALDSATGRANLAKARELGALARELGCSLAQLSIAWCALHPRVSTVILGATKSAQLAENLRALDALPKLSSDVLARIETIVANKPEPLARY
jgi:aryl-alcohol dehydrogenase-like predicted oxidoreductase